MQENPPKIPQIISNPSKQELIEILKSAKALRLGNDLSDKEMYVCNIIARSYNLAIFSQKAKRLQECINIIKSISQKPSKQVNCQNPNRFEIIFGEFDVRIKNKQSNKNAILLYPVLDTSTNFSRQIQYEIGTEFGVVVLLLTWLQDFLPKDIRLKLDTIDIGYISSESNISEEELDSFKEYVLQHKDKSPILQISSSLLYHTQSNLIAQILGLLEKYTPLEIGFDSLLRANEIHIGLLCDLSEDDGLDSDVIGIQTKGEKIIPTAQILLKDFAQFHTDKKQEPLFQANLSESISIDYDAIFQALESLPENNGAMICIDTNNSCIKAQSLLSLRVGLQFLLSTKLKADDIIELRIHNDTRKCRIILDESLLGTIGFLSYDYEFPYYPFIKADFKIIEKNK